MDDIASSARKEHKTRKRSESPRKRRRYSSPSEDDGEVWVDSGAKKARSHKKKALTISTTTPTINHTEPINQHQQYRTTYFQYHVLKSYIMQGFILGVCVCEFTSPTP